MQNKELTTLSASAMGSLVGGLLGSPLGPWAAVGGATVGTTLGGYVADKIWKEFYLDMGEKLRDVRRLLEEERASEAARVLIQLRDHPRFAQQEANFRSELEHTAAKVLGGLGERSEAGNNLEDALEHYRQAALFQPNDPALLWNVIRLATTIHESAYEDSNRLQLDLERLLALDGRHAGAVRSLAELHEKHGRPREAATVLSAAAAEASDRPKVREEFLRWGLRLAPNDPELVKDQASLLLDTGRGREALDLLETRGGSVSRQEWYPMLLGRSHHACGNWSDSRETLEPLAEQDEEAALLVGISLARMGEVDEASRRLGALATGSRVAARATLEVVPLLIQMGELEMAANHLEKDGLEEMAGYEPLLKRLSTAFEDRGQAASAARLYDRMRDLGDSSSFWARFTLQYRESAAIVLGSGPAGRVLLGKRREDDLSVAIREAPTPFALGGKAAKRFQREVEALSTLEHPNLVKLLGHALPESKCLLAMEYCAGGSLSNRLGTPPLWPEIKRIAEAVAAALVYLQEQETPLVHRNVKPSNVLFTADGAVKLADFAMTRAAEGTATSVVTSIKERAQLYLYQSPEVILGQADLGVQADVYSFGCLLYHLITGQPPFFHADVNRQIAAHFQDQPRPPSELAGWVPEELDRVVLQCLEKDPAKRYSDLSHTWRGLQPI